MKNHMNNGNKHQGNNQHTNQVNKAAAHQREPLGAFFYVGHLHRIGGESGNHLDHQSQHCPQKGTGNDQGAKVRIFPLQIVHHAQKGHKQDQNAHGSRAADHQKLLKKWNVHDTSPFAPLSFRNLLSSRFTGCRAAMFCPWSSPLLHPFGPRLSGLRVLPAFPSRPFALAACYFTNFFIAFCYSNSFCSKAPPCFGGSLCR